MQADRIDVFRGDELEHLDHPTTSGRRVEVLGLEQHQPPVLQPVPRAHRVRGNVLPAHRTHPAMPDLPTVDPMDLVESESVLLGGPEHPDRDGHQSEGDRSAP